MKFVSTKVAAKALGLTEAELRYGFKVGKYPGLRVGEKGGKYKFCVEEIIAHLQNNNNRQPIRRGGRWISHTTRNFHLGNCTCYK